MNKTKNRALSLLLTAAMVLSLFPASALGVEDALLGDTTPLSAAEPREKSLGGQDEPGEVTYATAPDGSAPGASGMWSAGTYVVNASMAATNITVSGDVTVWIAEGQTLTVNGTPGTAGVSTTIGTAGGNATSAVTIGSGAKLTLQGPGTLNITGGKGGGGGTSSGTASLLGINGAMAGKGAPAVDNGGTLEFGTNFSGAAKLTGGEGGRGGDAAMAPAPAVQTHSAGTAVGGTYSAGKTTGGTGGAAGAAAAGVLNNTNGKVIFNQDNGNSTLAKMGDYATGTVNIKGGKAGTGGTGGAMSSSAAISSVAATKTHGPAQSVARSTVQTWLATYSATDYDKVGPTEVVGALQLGTLSYRSSQAGNAGACTVAGVGVQNGTVEWNRGVATIEGGNSTASAAGSQSAKTTTWNNYQDGSFSASVNPKPDPDPDNPSGNVQASKGPENYSEPKPQSASCTFPGTPQSASAAAGVAGVTVVSNGGVGYIFGGNGTAAGGGVANGVTAVTNTDTATGTIIAESYTGQAAIGLTKLTLNYLEDHGDFDTAQNGFYVLGDGDWWTDVNDNKHTSAGIAVGANRLDADDLYVSPQGVLYLTGVDTTKLIEMDVAVGATLHGNAGDDSKEVRLDKSGAGVYHFSNGGNGATLTARYALDNAEDGTPEAGVSYDSSFDVYWLKGVNFGGTVEIETAPQLAAIAWAVNNGVAGAADATYTLKNDIDLGSFGWTPIGTVANPFKGTFSGVKDAEANTNYTISNLHIEAIDGVTAYGLFGYVVGAKISDFMLARDSFTHTAATTIKVNGAAGGATSGGGYSVLGHYTMHIEQPGEIYLGSAVGHGVGTTLSGITANNIPLSATSNNTAVMLGGIAGYTKDSKIDGCKFDAKTGTGDQKTDLVAISTKDSGTGDAYMGGIVGLGETTDVTKGTVNGINTFTAEAKTADAAYAGGVAGKITGTEKSAAVVSDNTVTATAANAPTNVTATAKGVGNAYAGGILGEGLEASVFSNQFLDKASSATNTVTATAPGATAWAGGLIGHIQNKGYYKVAVSDMTISNVAVSAEGGAGESYAGGIVGQSQSTAGLELTHLTIKGNSVGITSEASDNAYAGRLVGQGNKAVIIGCDLANTAAVTVSAASTNKDAYVGGLAGELLESGTVNVTGVWMTNIEADAAKTAWAGGLLGRAENTSITSSSVNYKAPDGKDDVAANFATSTLEVTGATTTFAGGIAGEIINNANTLRTAGEHTYKLSNAVSVTMTLPTNGVTAGGLYGKLNDGLIGTSYARDYTITGPTFATNNVAGVVGNLRSSELIAVYGVGAGGAVINDYPGMYATGAGNRFYGSYVLHEEFAPNPEEDGNDYANTYYVDATASAISLIPESVKDVADAEPYYAQNGALYELRGSYGGNAYRHGELIGTPVGFFNNSRDINDSMWNLLHFYRDKNAGVSTQYENRLGYEITYSRKAGTSDLHNNYYCPTFVAPKNFTLAILPGTDFGHVKDNEPGKNPNSSYIEPSTKNYTSQTLLVFTAEEQATLPKDPVFYSFVNWTLKSTVANVFAWEWKGADDEITTTNLLDVASAELLKDPIIRPVMPDGMLTLTANFKANDNYFRAEINKALSDAMTKALESTKLKTDIETALKRGTASGDQAAADLMMQVIDLTKVYETYAKYVGTGATSPNSGKTFAQTYPAANAALFNKLVDKNMVVKQIARDAVETVMARDTFKAGSFDTDITALTHTPAPDEIEGTKGGKVDYVDIGADLFTSGNFNKYASSQNAFEQSGGGSTAQNSANTQPGIASVAGMTVEIATLFDKSGDPNKKAPTNADTYGHGAVGGVYISYTDPTGKTVAEQAALWGAVPGVDGKYTLTVDESKLAKTGQQYLYICEVDENGYEVVTRVAVGTTEVAAENVAVNDGSVVTEADPEATPPVDEVKKPQTENVGIGNGATGDKTKQPLRQDSTALWFGKVELVKAEKTTVLVAGTSGLTITDDEKDSYYSTQYAGTKGEAVYKTQEISGAYAEGIYVEIPAGWVADETALPGYNADPALSTVHKIKNAAGEDVYEILVNAVDGATFTLDDTKGLATDKSFTGNVDRANFTDGDFKSGSLTYNPVTDVVVKGKYVNLIGEINAATGTDKLAEIQGVVANPHFAETMGIDPKTMAVYDAMDLASTDPTAIDKMLEKLTPAKGYATAGEVKDAFTYTTALQELMDIVDKPENAALIGALTTADQSRIKELKAQAETLMGDTALTGDLKQKLQSIYTTGDTLYKVLSGVRYSTVALTMKSNFVKYVSAVGGAGTDDPGSLVGTTLFGKGNIVTPPVSAVGAFAMRSGRNAPVLESKTTVILKNSTPTIVIPQTIAADGKYIVSATLNGLPVTFVEATGAVANSHEIGDWILTLTTAQTAGDLELVVTFETKTYKVKDNAPEPGTLIESVEHGADGTLDLLPLDENKFLVPGAEVTYTEGSTPKKTVVNPDGTVTFPNVKGEITDVDLSNATADSMKDALTAYVAAMDALDRDNYTPATWTPFAEKLAKAKAELAKVDADAATETELKAAYDALVEAQKKLIEQHEIDLAGSDLKPVQVNPIPNPGNKGDIDTLYATDTVKYYQNGVVGITSGGTEKFYVQDGYSVVLEPTNLGAGDNIKSVTYKEDTTEGKKAIVKGDNTVLIPNVTGAVTNVTTAKAVKDFSVVPGTGVTGEANPTGGSVPVYTLPNAEVTGIATAPTTVTVTVGGKDIVITIPDGGNDGTTVTVDGTSVTLPDGTTLVGIVTGTTGDQTVTVPGATLDKIVEKYNKGADNTPKIVVDKDTKVSAVTEPAGTPSTTNEPATSTPTTVPTYTVTPKPGEHVVEVKVDSGVVLLPEQADMDAIINGTGADIKHDGNTHTKTDPATGGKTVVTVDPNGKVISVTVDPGVTADTTVSFNTDLTSPDYGEAEIVWKDANKENHVVEATFAKNIYDITVKKPATGGEVTVVSQKPAPADPDKKITHGEDAKITLAPAEGMKVDPDAKVTITIPGVQGCPDVTITDTVKNLADKTKHPGITVTGVMPDGTIPGVVTITVPKVQGPVTVNAGNVFKNPDANAKTELELALDELKKAIDLGSGIVDANSPAATTYDTTDDQWKNFAGVAGTPGGKLADGMGIYAPLVADPVTGKLADALEKAATDKALVDAANKLLDKTGADKLTTVTEVLNTIKKATTDLNDAILKLTPKTANDIPVLPGITGEVTVDNGVRPDKKPTVTVPGDDGGIASGENITIGNIDPKPGKDLDKVIITVTDPTTGKEYTAEIPVNGGKDAGGDIIIRDKDSGDIIPTGKLPGKEIPSTVDGAKEDKLTDKVTVPGGTIDAIVDAITGAKPSTKGDGVVTEIEVTTKPSGGMTVPGNASVDAGVDTSSGGASTPQVTVPTTDGGTVGKIDIGTDGITVTPITPEAGYEYKGVEVTVTKPDGTTAVVFIPATGTNTTDKNAPTAAAPPFGNTNAPYVTTVTAGDLEAAIKKELGILPADAIPEGTIVTDVKVVTDALPLDPDATVTPGAGINTDITAPSIKTPSAGTGDGTTPGNGDLVIENVTPKPGFEVTDTVITVTDPVTGREVNVTIPAGTTAPDVGGEGNKLTVTDPATGNVIGTVTLPAGDKGGTVDADGNKVTVPGKTVQDIIDELTGKKGADDKTIPGSGTGVITGVTPEAERKGHALPDADKDGVAGNQATGDKGVDMTTAPTITDGSSATGGTENVLLPNEDLVVDNITLMPGFVLDGITVTLSDGTKVILPKADGKEGDNAKVTVTVIKPDGTIVGPKEVAVPSGTGITNVTSEAPVTDKITVDGEALEAIIKDAIGQTGEGIADVDITDVKVNTKADNSDAIIGLPEAPKPGTGMGGKDGEVPNITLPGIGNPANDNLVIEGVIPNPGYTVGDVTITVKVPQASGPDKTYEVKIPAGTTAPDVGKVTAQEVDKDGKPVNPPVELDATKLPTTDKGGTVAPSGTITVPGDTISDIITALTPDGVTAKGDITDVTVNGDRTGHALPPKTDPAGNGVVNGGTILTQDTKDTDVPSKMDPSKGITIEDVKAGTEGKKVTDVTVTVGNTVITVKPDGTITAKKDGVEVKLPADIKPEITNEDGTPVLPGTDATEPFNVTLPGDVLDTILAAAKETGNVSGIVVNTNGVGKGEATITGKAPDGDPTKRPAAVDNTQDLIVDNIQMKPGFELAGITVTLDNGTTVKLPKESTHNPDTGKHEITVTITKPDGTSEPKPVTILLPEGVTTGVGTAKDKGGSQKVTVPGASLDEIINAALGTPEAIAKGADITNVQVNARETGWILPTAEKIYKNGDEDEIDSKTKLPKNDGITGLTITNGGTTAADKSTMLVSPPKPVDNTKPHVITGDDNRIIVSKKGTLTLNMTYEKDDFPAGNNAANAKNPIYHIFDGLTFGGVTLTAKALAAAGVYTPAGNPMAQLYAANGTVALDVAKLAGLYKTATGNDFPGFEDMSIRTKPQNTQYASFVEDYDKVQALKEKDKHGTMNNAERKQYEDLVHKLVDSFAKDSKNELSIDNKSHLVDQQAVLAVLEKEIQKKLDAELSKQEIENLKPVLTGVNVDDIIGKIDGTNLDPLTEDEKKIIDAIKKNEEAIRKAEDNFGNLDEKGEAIVTPAVSGKLDDLSGILDAIKKEELGNTGFVIDLVNNLPKCPDIKAEGAVNSWDSLTNDATKTLQDRIAGLSAFERALKKAEKAFADLTTDEKKTVATAQKDLDTARTDLAKEYDDLAKVFAKDYLTKGTGAYTPGGNGTSNDRTSNSIKDIDGDIKNTAAAGMTAYNKLYMPVQEAINKLFHGPTLPELYEKTFAQKVVSNGLLTKEDILAALDKNGNSGTVDYVKPGDIDDAFTDVVGTSGKTEKEWIDEIIRLEKSYDGLNDADKGIVDSALGGKYDDLLDAANTAIAKEFIKDHNLGAITDKVEDVPLTEKQKQDVIGGKTDWGHLTEKQKEIVNGLLEEKTNKYPDLLDAADPKPATAVDRDAAKKAIEDKFNELLETPGLTDDQKKNLNDAMQDALDKIDAATTKDQVTAAKNAGTTNMESAVGGGSGGQTGGTGGGSGSSSNATVNKPTGGTVTVNPTDPKAGDKVTITVKPDEGFTTDKVVVKTAPGGKEVALTDNGDGTYTYTQPEGKVTIDATFKKVTGDPDSNGVSDLLNTVDHMAYLKGRSAELFAPTGAMTRGEVAQMFYNLLKNKDNNLGNKASFSDVSADAWYATAVNTLANIGIVEGVGEGSFAPERTITRAEFVVIATRFAAKTTGSKTYTDVAANYWAAEAIGAASYYGWIGGYTDGTFKPTASIARSEAAKVVNAMLGRSADKAFIDKAEGLKTFPDVPKTDWAYYEIVEATNTHDYAKKDGAESWMK